MLKIYHIIFQLILLSPLFLIFNNLLNKNIKLQKVLNNAINFIIFLSTNLLIIFYSIYGTYKINLGNFSNNIPILFSINSFNLFFCFAISFSLLLLNAKLQNSFTNFKLESKYQFYNKSIPFLSLFLILISFSNSITLTIFINICIILSSIFVITNPDLKDFRKNYSIYFCINMVTNIILIIISNLFFLNSDINIFTTYIGSKIDYIPTIWATVIFCLLLLINLSGPIFINLKDKFYYEDNLPVFIIYVIPTFFVNIFIFLKTLYYLFYSSFNNLGIYFYYTGFYIPIIFLISCFYIIKNIKNNSKVILAFIFSIFIIFLSQIMLVGTTQELIRMFSNLLIFILETTLLINIYCDILFVIFNNNITEFSVLHKQSKLELNFYMVTVSIIIFSLLLSFFDLDLNSFNLLFFINLIEIAILAIIMITYFFLAINRKVIKSNENKITEIINNDIYEYFLPEIISFILFIIILLIKSQIVKYILYYK